MKIRLERNNHSGMAVIVVLTLLALLLIYVSANARTLYHLGRELKLIDQQQTNHWAQVGNTNAVAPGKR
jgi:type II secretory pathway component PulK